MQPDEIVSELDLLALALEDNLELLDVESASFLLVDIRRVMESAKVLDRMVTDALVKLLPREASLESRTVPGVGVLEIHGGGPKSVHYDMPLLLSAAAERVAEHVMNPDSDGVLPETREMIHAAVKETASLCSADTAGFNKFRKGQAGRLGLELGQYELERSTVRTPKTIQIH